MLMSLISAAQSFPLNSTSGLQPHDVTVEAVSYQGRKSVRIMPAAPAGSELIAAKNAEGGGIVVLQGTSFHNGTIEVDLAGKPRTGAGADARGFVGLAFRMSADPSRYECFYVRPTNGRADDQVRRNHATQYISMPEYDWSRLRREAPGRYESYVDLVPGEWTNENRSQQHGVSVAVRERLPAARAHSQRFETRGQPRFSSIGSVWEPKPTSVICGRNNSHNLRGLLFESGEITHRSLRAGGRSPTKCGFRRGTCCPSLGVITDQTCEVCKLRVSNPVSPFIRALVPPSAAPPPPAVPESSSPPAPQSSDKLRQPC